MVIKGMAAQIAEQILVATSGGASIPWVIPLLCTRSKYSPVPSQTAAATAVVNTHPPATTIPRQLNPRRSPNNILIFSCPFCGAGGEAGGAEGLLKSFSLAPPCNCTTCKHANQIYPASELMSYSYSFIKNGKWTASLLTTSICIHIIWLASKRKLDFQK